MPSDQEKYADGTEPKTSYGYCYAFGIFFPLFYLGTVNSSKQNPRIRFHCFQSLIFFAVWLPLYFIPRTSRGEEAIVGLLSALGFVTWIVSWVLASRGRMFRLPGIGDLAHRIVEP